MLKCYWSGLCRCVHGKRKSIIDFTLFFAMAALVFCIWKAGWIWIDENIKSVGEETASQARGLFGDKFGAVNALFSGLAFAGIILTLLLQRRELSQSRSELSHQQFDNAFFNLLRLHIDITSKISYSGENGRKAFVALYERIKVSNPDFSAYLALQKIQKERIRALRDNPVVDSVQYPELLTSDITNLTMSLTGGLRAIDGYLDEDLEMHERIIAEAYGKVASQAIDDFAHYYRNLYHILRFIDKSKLISVGEKKEYSKFVRAQLSDVELVTIFYNSLTSFAVLGRDNVELGFPKMTKLLKKYDLLQSMNPRNVIHPIHFKIFEKNSGGSQV